METSATTERTSTRGRRQQVDTSKRKVPQSDEILGESLSKTPKRRGDFGAHVFWGLTLAGVASSCLTTIFGIFHVQVRKKQR